MNKTELYIMGDYNIDMYGRKNPMTKKLVELTKPYGLRQVINTQLDTQKTKIVS